MGLFDAVASMVGAGINYAGTTQTNVTNSKIAEDNLNYQRERNFIEDQRYEDETAYNRAFAEDQRDYERALQQQIFDREDTAIERQASQLAALGINPAAQQLNGLGAGQAVSPGAAPSASARGGEALHNDFQAMKPDFNFNFGDLLSEVNAIDELNTRGINRDLLRTQEAHQRLINQQQAIDNLIKMDKYNISVDENGDLVLNQKFDKKEQDFSSQDYANKEATKQRNQRENVFQNEYGTHDNSSTRMNDIADVSNQAVRAATATQKLGSMASNSANSAASLITQSAKKKMSNYKQTLKNGWENDKRRFKNFWNKVNDFGNKYLGANY